MIITVASTKGGVGKTTTAVHLAAYLNGLAKASPALLLDGDPTRNAMGWAERGGPFPFRTAPIGAEAKLAREYEHVVIDSGQRPDEDDLQEAVNFSDLLVLPVVPSALDVDGLGQTIRMLQKIEGAKYRVLLTRVAPDAARAAEELRGLLKKLGAPCFRAEIPRLKAFEKAADLGSLAADVDDRNAMRAGAAYVAVGRECVR